MNLPCCQLERGEEGEALPVYEASPELAMAALLSLMSRFPVRRSLAVAQSIVSHLKVISRDERVNAPLRERAAYLVCEWEAMAVLAASLDGTAQ
jgi:hypothetical protein